MTNAAPPTPARPWLAALLTGLIAAAPAAAGGPPWLERWLFNSAERTERAIEGFEQGDVEAAVEALETALRLAPGDPRVQINAGAGRLATGRGDALTLLEAAAGAVAGELTPWARYNLGNARMAGGDLPGAIEAYQQALRADPDHQDAKYNLELARRRLETQEQQESQEQAPREPPPQDQQQSSQPESPQDQPSQERPQDPQPGSQHDDGREGPQEPGRESPLPQFRDLPDMTAEEAAAILQAVENMEREGRRREALEAVRQNRSGKKDW